MLQFDEKGHLFPYEIITLTLAEFEAFFVNGLDDRAHRQGLFQSYLRFLQDLRVSLGAPFYHWVDGSFITTKEFPGDIDIVAFLDSDLMIKKAEVVFQFNEQSKKKYSVDAHFAPVTGRRSPYFERTKENEDKWLRVYGTSRLEHGICHPKGIIKIECL